MQTEPRAINPKIVKLASDKMFFEVFDTLTSKDKTTGKTSYGPQYRMLKFSLLNHKQKSSNGKSAWVWFSMHEREFLLVRNAILSKKLGTKGEGNHYVSYKGTASAAYSTGFQSRIVEIEKQQPMNTPSRPDVSNKAKIVFNIENGAGTKGKTGQVMPAKDSGTDKIRLQFAMDEGVAIAMVEEIYLYLQGWHSTNAKEIINSHIEWADYRNEDNNFDAVQATVDVTPDDIPDSNYDSGPY